MKKIQCEGIDNVFQAILSLESIDECYAFFGDLCTAKELFDMALRLEVARQLDGGLNYTQISRSTGASTTTISRVNKCLLYGNDGYKTVLDRLKEGKK